MSDLMGRRLGTSGRAPAKAFAVLAVALMLAITVFPMLSSDYNVSAEDTGHSEVKYYANNGENAYKIIPYNGVTSAEYNPERAWNSSESSWTGPSTTVTVPFKGTLSINFSSSYDSYRFKIPEGVEIDTSNISIQHNRTGYTLEDNRDISVSVDDNNCITLFVPRYWYDGFLGVGAGFRSDISGTVAIPFSCNYKIDVKTVFAGWTTKQYAVDTTHDNMGNPINIIEPGDVLENVDELYALWYTPNLYLRNLGIENITAIGQSEPQNLNLRQIECLDHILIDENAINQYNGTYRNLRDVVEGIERSYTQYSLHPNNPYTTIRILDCDEVNAGDYLPMGTYRSADSPDKDVATLYLREAYEGNWPWQTEYDLSLIHI